MPKDSDPPFDGFFHQNSNSQSEDEEEENGQKKKQKNKKEKKSKSKKFERPRIVLNVSDTKYDVVKFVGLKVFKW